jgi:putative ABC transport system substrate-binding protein
MDRRDVLVILAATCAGVHAQDKAVRRIGVVGVGPPPTPEDAEAAMKPARDFGWIEGQNFEMVRRFGGRDEVDGYAAHLVRSNVELIVAPGAAAALAAKRATSRIPIVMVSEVDPVAIGLVASLAHPGGNVTGVAELTDVTNGKRLELLRDLLPHAKRIGVVIYTRAADTAANQVNEKMYASFGMLPVAFKVGDARELFDTVNEAARRGTQALVVVPPGLRIDEPGPLMNAAVERKLPVITDDPDYVAAGALASLGNDWSEQFRTLWYLIDQILRHGKKPADLPVQQPTRFLTTINAKTAKALGLAISPQVLQRANQVFN